MHAENADWASEAVTRVQSQQIVNGTNLRATIPMKTQTEVIDWAEHEPSLGPEKIKDMRIAVAALIFDNQGKILLHCRGEAATDAIGCLEGIGGTMDSREDTLEGTMSRELEEEISGDCRFSIDEFLVCSHLQFVNRSGESKDWAVATFLCTLISGEPGVGEPANSTGIGWFDLEELASWGEEERRRVQLLGHDGRQLEMEVGLSIWVPTVIREYIQRHGKAPWRGRETKT
jgi:8-oxo-dGTP pyrophosphatase MutT (NUDIX family)